MEKQEVAACAFAREQWLAGMPWLEWMDQVREAPALLQPPDMAQRVQAAVYCLAYLPGDFPGVASTHTLMHPHTRYTRQDVLSAATWLVGGVLSELLAAAPQPQIDRVQTGLDAYLSFVCDTEPPHARSPSLAAGSDHPR